MKLLVLSNVPKALNKVVDLVDSSNSVMAKELELDTNTLASRIREELESSKYDICLVVADNPIRMGVLLNKSEGIYAAVCGSEVDVSLAKEDNANVIIIRDADSDGLKDMISAITVRGWSRNIDISAGLKKISGALKKAETQKGQQNIQEKQVRTAPKKQAVKEEVKEEKKNEEEKELPLDKNMGLIDRLKDSLGIV